VKLTAAGQSNRFSKMLRLCAHNTCHSTVPARKLSAKDSEEASLQIWTPCRYHVWGV